MKRRISRHVNDNLRSPKGRANHAPRKIEQFLAMVRRKLHVGTILARYTEHPEL